MPSILNAPAPIPISRVHRLLRPLRAALSNLSLDLVALEAKQAELHLTSNQKGKAKDNPKEDEDGEWLTSSPFRNGAKKRKPSKVKGKATMTYSKKRQAARPQNGSSRIMGVGTSEGVATNKRKDRRSTGSGGGISILLDAKSRLSNLEGWDQVTTNKALHLIKTYSNLLKPVLVSRPSPKGKEKEHELPSLTEMMAREIGRNIEANVRSCREEEEHDSSEDEGVAMRRKAELDDGDNETTLMDEWYEACPDYCSRWILAEHATSIVIDGLEAPPFELIEILSEMCAHLGALDESSRFFDALNHIALPLLNPSSNAHALASRTSRYQQGQLYIDSLHSALLESSFADRLFYSPFLSLASAHLFGKEDDDVSAVVALIEMVCAVARDMVQKIDIAANAGEQGSYRLVGEVLERVARELATAMQILLDGHEPTSLVIARAASTDDAETASSLRTRALARICDSTLELAVASSDSEVAVESLGAILVAIITELALRGIEDDSDADLSHTLLSLMRVDLLFASVLEDMKEDQAEVFDYLTPQLTRYCEHHTSQGFASLLSILRFSNLHTLEHLILRLTAKSYHSFIDVRFTRGRTVLDITQFTDRLNELEGKRVDTQTRNPETPARPRRLIDLSSSLDRVRSNVNQLVSSPVFAQTSLGSSDRKSFVPSRHRSLVVGKRSIQRGSSKKPSGNAIRNEHEKRTFATMPTRKLKQSVNKRSKSYTRKRIIRDTSDETDSANSALESETSSDSDISAEESEGVQPPVGSQILEMTFSPLPTSEAGDDIDLLLSAVKRSTSIGSKRRSTSFEKSVAKKNKILRRAPSANGDTSDDELAI